MSSPRIRSFETGTTTTSPSNLKNRQTISLASLSPDQQQQHQHQHQKNQGEHESIVESMNVSTWPSGRAGKQADFVCVLEKFLDDQLHRIDGEFSSSPSAAAATPSTSTSTTSPTTSTNTNLGKSNFPAIARVDLLKKCCTAFEHHFKNYSQIFLKMGTALQFIYSAFDQQHKLALEIEKWKAQVMKREELLRQQMNQMVEQHEREFATEAQLKQQLDTCERQLIATRKELDETYRTLVHTQDTLNEANERVDELSRNHVVLTLRETKMKEEAEIITRQVESSHNHAEAKAREVGELRQEMALHNARYYQLESRLRETENQLQTSLQTLSRKDRDIEEKDMELARLKQTSTARLFAEAEAMESDRIEKAVKDKHEEMLRTYTPRPEWQELAIKYADNVIPLKIMKPGFQQHTTGTSPSTSAATSRPPSQQAYHHHQGEGENDTIPRTHHDDNEDENNNNDGDNSSNHSSPKQTYSPNKPYQQQGVNRFGTSRFGASSSKAGTSPTTVVLTAQQRQQKLMSTTKKLSENVVQVLNQNIVKTEELQNELTKYKELAETAMLENAMLQHRGGKRDDSMMMSGSGVANTGLKPVRAGNIVGGKSPRNKHASSSRGGKNKQQQSQEGTRVDMYAPVLRPPEYLRTTKPVVCRQWTKEVLLIHLSSAIDYITNFLAFGDSQQQQQQQQHVDLEGSLSGGRERGGGGYSRPGSSLNHTTSAERSPSRATAAAAATSSSALSNSASLLPQLRNRFTSMNEAQVVVHWIEQQNRTNSFAEAFQQWLLSQPGDAPSRREFSYNIVYHCQEPFENDVFARAFLLSLGADIPPDSLQRIRTFVVAFRRSFEVHDQRCSGFVAKRSLTNLIKQMMSLYSGTEQKLVLACLDTLPEMSVSGRAETLLDYRVLFSDWSKPTHFMTLLSIIFFRAMCVDTEAAIAAVKNSASTSTNDISIGALISALQSCDVKRDIDSNKEFVTRCCGQSTIKAARVNLDLLVPRLRRCFLPRCSAFPAEINFSFRASSVPQIGKYNDNNTNEGGGGETKE